jgi:hypothetical protein
MLRFVSIRNGLVALMLPATSAAGWAQAAPSIRWIVSGSAPGDFDLTRDTTVAHSGRASIRIHAGTEPSGFVTVMTSMPGETYIGHRLRFSVFFRAQSLTGVGGQFWVRADGANRPSLAFFNSMATPVRGTADWTQVNASLDVPANTARVYFGVISDGTGTLWADDVRVEVDGGSPMEFGFENATDFVPPPVMPRAVVAREPPHPLSERGLANVGAFTTALGYVRFFHPTPEAVTVNWDAFAVRGIRAVEKAPTADSLAATLATLFAPISSGLRFLRTGTAIPSEISKPASATHVVFWRHMGVGMPSGGPVPNRMQTPYASERVVAPLSDVGRPIASPNRAYRTIVSLPNVPDPSRPVIVPLDGGVTMSLPIALYTSDSSVSDALRSPQPGPNSERLTPSDRATRLAGVALAWSLFEHFYPYFGVVRTDWPAVRTAALRTAAVDSTAGDFLLTLRRLVAALRDGHGGVYHSSSPQANADVRLAWAEGKVFVTAAGDSAARKGVRVGDEVLTIDGRAAADAIAAASEFISGATTQWIRTRAVNELLAGNPAAAVQIRLRDSTGATREVRLARGRPVSLSERQIDKIAEPAPGVTYVDLDRITDADINGAMPRLQAARAIIFDMRGYPRQVNTAAIMSHLTDTAIHSAHFKIPLITMPKYKDVGFIDGAWTIQPMAARLKARVIFLSGGGAISYAESTLGVVEGYRLGDIVGEPSAGTNGNVNGFVLPGGYNVAWTGMLVEKRDGTPHHGVGIVPTLPVSPTAAGMRAGKDEVLQRAIELVTARVVP